MMLQAGIPVGPYDLLSPAGAPALGEPYRARDRERQQLVRLDVVPVDFGADPSRLQRLERDVAAAAAFTHPNALTIHDVGTDPHTAYIVSEPFDGFTLRELLDSGTLTPRLLVRFAAQIARALLAAHWAEITHGDVRPETVWVAAAEPRIVLSFGLASLTRPGTPRSDWGAFLDVVRAMLTASSRAPREFPRPAVARPAAWLFGAALLVMVFAVMTTQPPRESARTVPAADIRGEIPPFVPSPRKSPAIEAPAAPLPSAPPPEALVDVTPSTVPAAPAERADAIVSRRSESASARPAVPAPSAAVARQTPRPDMPATAPPSPATPRPEAAAVIDPPPVIPRGPRSAASLIAEASTLAAEFDLAAAANVVSGTADAEEMGVRVAALYLSGLSEARNAAQGRQADALGFVHEAIRELGNISHGRPGPAEIARLVLHAAAAAAQNERDEMRLYLDTALQMESLQHAASQPAAPLIAAAEVAGDLFLQVQEHADAQQAYRRAFERLGSTPRILYGMARAAEALNDRDTACARYEDLLRAWGARPSTPPQIANARAYVAACAPAGVRRR